MVSRLTISKGLDIRIEGEPRQAIGAANEVSTVALSGLEAAATRPRILVEPGQCVRVGEPLLAAKHNAAVQFTAPAGGTVTAINRGPRRLLQSIVIELDDSDADAGTFDIPERFDRNSIRALLLKSGAWTALRTRPFGRVPDPDTSPAAVFVTAIDTRPLAADPTVIIARYQNQFARGLELIAQVEAVPVYLCTGPGWVLPEFAADRVTRVAFAGPHPAGLPGTHIHFLQPAAADRVAWHIDYQQVIAIGHLAMTGRLMTERVVALGGPGVLDPRLVVTRPGANLAQLLAGELEAGGDFRVISGSVLDGFAAEGPQCYLGYDHKQVSVIPDRPQRGLFAWFGFEPGGSARNFPVGHTQTPVSNAQRGRRCTMLPTEDFERVMPLDILPAPLLRALLVQDTDSARALGCLELVPEDLALCSYVCPAKQDYGAALGGSLAVLEEEG